MPVASKTIRRADFVRRGNTAYGHHRSQSDRGDDPTPELVLEAIHRILRECVTCETEEDLGRTCLTVAEDLTGSRFGFFAEMNAEGRLDNVAISDPGWAACRMDMQAGRRQAPANLEVRGIYGRVILDGKGFFTNDPASHPDRIGTPPGHPPLKAFMGVPLNREGRTIGMVALGNRDGGYREGELAALEALAPVIVEVLSLKRAEGALRKAHEELESRVQERTAELKKTIGGAGGRTAAVQ